MRAVCGPGITHHSGQNRAHYGCLKRGGRTCVKLVVKAGSKPPSMRPSATELEALEEMSIVIPDTLILEELSEIEPPKAATVGFGVLSKILSSPGGLREYKVIGAISLVHEPLDG